MGSPTAMGDGRAGLGRVFGAVRAGREGGSARRAGPRLLAVVGG